MTMVDKSEKFSLLVRVGYFSRAIMYSVLGLIALTSAGKISEGTDGIFKAIEDFPLGEAILWLMVVGLFAYALFRFASTFFDIENHGSDTVGWGTRIGHAGSAIRLPPGSTPKLPSMDPMASLCRLVSTMLMDARTTKKVSRMRNREQ